MAALLVVQGVQPAIIVYLTRPLVDSVAVLVGGDAASELSRFLLFAALMGGVLLLGEVVKSAMLGARARVSRELRDHVSAVVQMKAMEVDLAFYENSEYYDSMHRAREQANSGPLALLDSASMLLKNTVAMMGIAVVLIPYGWWLPIVLIASALPSLIPILRHQWRIQRWWRRTTPDRRWADYYNGLITSAQAALELRLFGWGPRFHKRFVDLRERLRTEEMRLIRHELRARLLGGTAGLLIFGAVLVWIVWRAVNGYATLGDLALFYQAFNQGQTLIHGAFDSTGQIFSRLMYLSSLFEYLDQQPIITDSPQAKSVPATLREGIRFQGVTFHYPETERAALEDFDLWIPASQTVALVGSNGAGKSSVVKLLCRFYDPDAGSITIDGVDIRELKRDELRRRVTVMFQHPVPYTGTVSENIQLGDPEAPLIPARIEEAAKAGGADEVVAGLPQGYDTLLGRLFASGTELSGGERQRLALARAFYRQAQIVILDEPTSFMDSWAEAEWLGRFDRLVEDRTAILITHRFTTAMRADIIHVMDDGRIVESGTHAELMDLGGRYASSWITQMRASDGSVVLDPRDSFAGDL